MHLNPSCGWRLVKHLIRQHVEHAPGVAEIWHEDKLNVTFTTTPGVVLAFVVSPKGR